MIDTAIILCGGRGSRFGDANRPKSLIPVHGRPIIWYIITRLRRAGFKRFILPLGFRGQDIRHYVEANLFNQDCTFHCLDTGDDTPIGRRIEQVRHLLPSESAFLLTNGDAVFDFDIEGMADIHQKNVTVATFAIVETISKFGLFLVDDGKVVSFERDSEVVNYAVRYGEQIMSGHVYSGIAILNEDVLNLINLNVCENFEMELYPALIAEAETNVFPVDGFWYAIDTPKDLRETEGLYSVPISALVKKLDSPK